MTTTTSRARDVEALNQIADVIKRFEVALAKGLLVYFSKFPLGSEDAIDGRVLGSVVREELGSAGLAVGDLEALATMRAIVEVVAKHAEPTGDSPIGADTIIAARRILGFE